MCAFFIYCMTIYQYVVCENLCFNLQVLVHDPPIHIIPYHSGVLCLIQLKMEPNSSSLIHHSIDIHLVALLQTYTEIYVHLYNVSELFWPSLYILDIDSHCPYLDLLLFFYKTKKYLVFYSIIYFL